MIDRSKTFNKTLASRAEGAVTPSALGRSPISGDGSSLLDSVGRHVPVVKINDYYFASRQIEYIRIETTEFLPSVYAVFSLDRNNPIAMNQPKDGDVISVFMRPMSDVMRSLRCDFRITKVFITNINQSSMSQDEQAYYQMIIKGDINVPNLYTEGHQYAFSGTSHETIRDFCQRYRLGYVSGVQSDTTDQQAWYLYGQKPIDFIQDIIAHSWRDEESFFDGWIDPFLNLTFSNVNTMLGRTKADDGSIDWGAFVSITGREFADRSYAKNAVEKDGAFDFEAIPLVLSNIPQMDKTPYFVKKYRVENKASAISSKYGHVIELDVNMNNQALAGSGVPQNRQVIRIEPCYNKDKIKDHIILRGRARDGYNNGVTGETFADNDTETIVRYVWGGDSHVFSDGDGKSGNTNGATGNTHKNYIRAYYHNLINKVELEKLTLVCTLNGLNTFIYRGQKVPTLLLEQSNIDMLFNSSVSNPREEGETPQAVFEKTMDRANNFMMFYSGWFVTTGIRYIYERPPITATSTDEIVSYRTEVFLSRREWLPPEAISPITIDDSGKVHLNPNARAYGSSSNLGKTSDEGYIGRGYDSSYSGGTSAPVNPMSGGFTPHGDIGKPVQFEGSKKEVYNELVSLVDKYIASKSKGAKRMSGSVFVSMCAKYKLDISLALAQCQIEGNFATMGRPRTTNSAFSVGLFDTGETKFVYTHPDESVEPYCRLMQKNYLQYGKKSAEELLRGGFVNASGQRYASARNYESNVSQTRNNIISQSKIMSLYNKLVS